MTELIACLTSGKGTWAHVLKVAHDESWDKVILITNKFGKENFKNEINAELIEIDENKTISEMVVELKNKLKGKIKGVEVALNVVSGTGKEHMALLSALLKLGLAVRLIALTKDGIKEV